MPLIHRAYPKILQKHWFLFILGITVVSGELCKILGERGGEVNRVYYKQCETVNSDPFPAFPWRSYFYGGERKRKKTRLSVFLVHLTV